MANLNDTYISIIPTLISNTDKGFTITRSKIYSVLWDSYLLFDKGTITTSESSWAPGGLSNDWVMIKFPSPNTIGKYKYSITSSNRTKATTADPKAWKVYGSIDGITFDLLSDISSQSIFGISEIRYFDIQLNKEYTYIKFLFTEKYGTYVDLIISEINIFKKVSYYVIKDSNNKYRCIINNLLADINTSSTVSKSDLVTYGTNKVNNFMSFESIPFKVIKLS